MCIRDRHIAPLIVAAKLHIAAVVLEHVVEVVALHDHVVELEEGQALLHALLIAPVSYTHLDVYKRQPMRRLSVPAGP